MQENIKKTVTFSFRLTKQEKIVFSDRADEAGLSLTGWMCMKLRKAAADELDEQGAANPFIQGKNSKKS